MSEETKLMCGILLITIPTIQYGGYFLLQIMTGKHAGLALNPFQKSMFRAGHAHAGVIVILSIIAQILVDYSGLSSFSEYFVRIGFPVSAILIPGGFFGAAIGKNITRPTKMIWLLYLGAILLFAVLLTLGIALIVNR